MIGGCVLGLVQIGIGIAIGMWLRRGDSTDSDRSKEDMRQAGLIAQRLQSLADEMSSNVGAHRAHLDQASQALTSDEHQNDEKLAEFVTDVIGDIVRANQSLQTKLETAEKRLQEQQSEIETHISRSMTDPLTGLPNRRDFSDRLEERMAGWKRRGEVFSLLMLDVDHFKKLNDKHGHQAGDEVLKTIGRALRGVLRRDDAVARYGGEEFVMILPGTTLEQARAVAEKVRQTIAKVEVNRGGTKITATISGGLATIQREEQSESLMQRADAALYAAKAGGRNCAYLHDGKVCRANVETPAGAAAPFSTGPKGTEKKSAGRAFPAANQPPHEEISAELAQTCEELRQFVEERDKSHRQTMAQPRA